MNKTFLLVLLLITMNATARDYPATVNRVIDGDTVECVIYLGFGVSITESVRLAGIDAPEMRGSEVIAGAESKQALIDMLPTEIMLRTGKDERDKFGRVLGTIFVGPTDINQKMIDEGYAKEYQ